MFVKIDSFVVVGINIRVYPVGLSTENGIQFAGYVIVVMVNEINEKRLHVGFCLMESEHNLIVRGHSNTVKYRRCWLDGVLHVINGYDRGHERTIRLVGAVHIVVLDAHLV